MEMTFPHFVLRQDSVSPTRLDAMLATVIARQANSRTVRTMRRAERAMLTECDPAEQRIHYFAHNEAQKIAVYGPFWRNNKWEPTSEQAVYQAGSMNIKVLELEQYGTGEQFNHAGHGALRKS
jgi:hypothetical protein